MANKRKYPKNPYTYILSYPDGTPYYVGLGQGNRAWTTGRNKWAERIREKIERSGGSVLIEVLEHETRDEAVAHEIELIAQYGRRDNNTGILVNLSDGGEGPTGIVRSDEWRRKRSALQSGRPCHENSRQAVKKAMVGNKHRLGKKHSDHTIASLRVINKDNWNKRSEDSKTKHAELHRARMMSLTPEERSERARKAGQSRRRKNTCL